MTNKSVGTKKRIEELDIVKGIAIIYVFFRHLCELTGVNSYGAGVYAVFDCCTESFMFLFVLLSGYVYKSKGSIRVDVKNKFKQLLVPYFIYCSFFSLTYFVRYVLLGEMAPGLFLRNVISNFLAKPNLDIPALGSGSNVMRYAVVPYWYIAEIFMAFLLFIIVSKCIENKKLYARIIAASCLLVVASILMYLDLRGLLVETFTSKTSYFTVLMNIVGFAGLLMLGTILRQFRIFDVEAYAKKTTGVVFVISLIVTVVQIALYDNQYALQFGKWGQYGIWSVAITTVTGFALTYTLIYISYYMKRVDFMKRSLSFLGTATLDILLLHFGIGELICMIFGFWVPVYDMAYPEEIFAWWHFGLVVVLTAVIVLGYLYIKKLRRRKDKMRKKLRVLLTVLKRTNASKIISGFVAFFFIVSLIIMLVEPGINRYQDALWYSYSVFSTIGFGDQVTVTFIGHLLSVMLSIAAIVVIAVVTGVIVAFYNEVVSMQYRASKAEVLDKLVRLPELSKEELAEVSEQIKKLL